jgi:DNA-binding MarR family transcriptional regulator
MEGAGNLDGMDLAFIQVAYALEPDPLTPEIFITRTPYARPESYIENILATVERGWLQQETGKFRLTEAGREVAFELFDLGDRLCANIEGLPEPEMEQLLALHNKVCIKIKTLPEPAEKPAFELSLRLRRGPTAPLFAQIRRRVIDLLAFRDDVHMAAWMPQTDEGHLWEAFTLIWRQQAGTAAELAEQLSHRSYDETDYAATLDRLVACGWIARLGEKYVVRTKAARMRQRVEKDTDQLYQAAFDGLSATEVAAFQDLMEAFVEAVTLPEIVPA